MSKGSPVIPVRIPAELLAEIEETIQGRNDRASGAPWTRSEFILTALREKLAKMQRSRSSHKRCRPRPHLGAQVAGDVPGDGLQT